MDPTVLGSVIGVVGSLIIVAIEKMGRTQTENMKKIRESVSNIQEQVTALRIELPTQYVTKEEMLRHIRSEENWQNQTNNQLREIREEISASRSWHSHS